MSRAARSGELQAHDVTPCPCVRDPFEARSFEETYESHEAVARRFRIDWISLDDLRAVQVSLRNRRLEELVGHLLTPVLAFDEEAGKRPDRVGFLGEVSGTAKTPIGRARSDRAPCHRHIMVVAKNSDGHAASNPRAQGSFAAFAVGTFSFSGRGPPNHAVATLGAAARVEETCEIVPVVSIDFPEFETRGRHASKYSQWGIAIHVVKRIVKRARGVATTPRALSAPSTALTIPRGLATMPSALCPESVPPF